jgi:outer membrane biosynthesis protein TonB
MSALLLTACTVTNGHADRSSETILYAPRLLNRIMDPWDYYPDASKRAIETGEVVLHFRIGADGIAEEPFVVDEAHSTAPRLVKAARQLFQRSRYEIGEPYRHEVTASVLFEIMPCWKLQPTSGLDYYYRLCNPPNRVYEDAPHF